jgi:hypothetical protein
MIFLTCVRYSIKQIFFKKIYKICIASSNPVRGEHPEPQKDSMVCVRGVAFICYSGH